MTHRERVLKIINHQEADRVAIDFGGWLSGIKEEVYGKLCNYLGFGHNEWDTYSPSEKILKHFYIDFRRVTPLTPDFAKAKIIDKETKEDVWGVQRVFKNNDDQIVHYPLKDATSESLKDYKLPSTNGAGRYETLKSQAEKLKSGGYAVVAQPDVNGIFEQACWLCGFDKILLDLALNPDFIKNLFEKITTVQEAFATNYYKAVGNSIDIVQLGDDFATQNGPFFSEKMYKELVVPYQMRYHKAIKKNTDAKIFHHSCGAVTMLLDEMINAGVEILNPIQISAFDMEPEGLKKRFGDKVVFHGGIDVQSVLPHKSPKEVKEEVKRIIDIMAPGGGYILAPSHNIQDDVPPENIVAMYEAAIEYGNY